MNFPFSCISSNSFIEFRARFLLENNEIYIHKMESHTEPPRGDIYMHIPLFQSDAILVIPCNHDHPMFGSYSITYGNVLKM